MIYAQYYVFYCTMKDQGFVVATLHPQDGKVRGHAAACHGCDAGPEDIKSFGVLTVSKDGLISIECTADQQNYKMLAGEWVLKYYSQEVYKIDSNSGLAVRVAAPDRLLVEYFNSK